MPIELPPGTADYSDRSRPPSNRSLLLVGGVAIGILLALLGLLYALLNNLVWWIPPSVEQSLGKLIVPVYERQAKPSPTQDTLNRLLDQLEANLPESQRQGRDYQVLYVPEPTVNAAAIPGDRVIIFAGLLEQAQSENELMMVLGHELGHFANRDHLRGIGQALLIQVIFSTLLGDPGSLVAIAAQGVATLSRAQFSQTQERQADEVGLTLLTAHYGHAAGAIDFFARMGQKERSDLAILATHPPSKQRVAALERLIQERRYKVGTKVPLPETLQNLTHVVPK